MEDYIVPSQEECHRLFTKIDYNGNNILSLAELDKAVIETWPAFDNKPAIMRAYKSADKNGDGFIKRMNFASFSSLFTTAINCGRISPRLMSMVTVA
jgi:Ca2+-binding EF-hand superfamily protein